MADNPPPIDEPTSRARHPLRRPGCIIGLVIWFVLLLTPCILIMLAARGEITIATGSAPEQYLRIWLIQEARQSGIGISNAAVQQYDGGICVQTNVSFLMWRDEAKATQFCDCYQQAESDWQSISTEQGACPAPP